VSGADPAETQHPYARCQQERGVSLSNGRNALYYSIPVTLNYVEPSGTISGLDSVGSLLHAFGSDLTVREAQRELRR
jgi:hypothetical protein